MYDEIASGGMAAVHLGRFSSDAGFSRIVAMKYLHPNYARDAEFISMFLDEARLVSRIRHPNVASPLDVVVVAESQEIFLVMEYVHGETLAWLLDEAEAMHITMPPNICASILSGALHGLHAAHEAVDETGAPLNIVHRDFSPQNIMVGADGVARVLDFGVAKAVSRAQSTRQGQVKGKVSYMAPEQLAERPVDRRSDIFAAGIVLWEALTMGRLFTAKDALGAMSKVLESEITRPSSINGNVSQALDRVVLKALQRNPAARYQTAREFAAAIEEEAFVAPTRKVAEWVSAVARRSLAEKGEKVRRLENDAVDATPVREAQQSVKSMLTISQTVAILRESELRDGAAWAAPVVEREHDTENTPTEVLPLPVQTAPPACLEPTAQMRRPLPRLHRIVFSGLVVTVVAFVVAFVGVTLVKPPSPAPAAESPSSLSARPAVPARITSLEAVPGLGPALVEGAAPRPQAKRALAKPARAGKAAAAKPTKKDCVPPFSIDGNGIRRIKPQCL